MSDKTVELLDIVAMLRTMAHAQAEGRAVRLPKGQAWRTQALKTADYLDDLMKAAGCKRIYK